MRLQDKVAIITGGGGKIAKAYALAMAQEGARICVPDIVDATPVVEAIKGLGGEAITTSCDVSDEQSVQAMVDMTVARFGGEAILVNNAAYFMTVKRGPFWEMEVEEFDKALAVNVRGAWLCAKAVFPHMKARGGGKIINMGSTVALTGQPNYLHYVASKGAIIAMSRAMAREVGQFGIRVNTISPGFTLTEGRDVSPEVAARNAAGRAINHVQVEKDLIGTLLFLASSDSDQMTGQDLVVDGGSYFT